MRSFVRRLLCAGLLVVAVACSNGAPSPGSAPVTQPPPTLEPVDVWAPTPGPFREPEQLYAQDGVLSVSLTAAKEVVEVGGSPLLGTTYNGAFIGPTLHVSPGDTLDVDLTNNLDEITNLHFHGFHVSPSGNSDNIFLHIEPGATQRYHVEIPADHEPGLFWYHSHAHGISSGQVLGGLSGLIVMEGLEDQLPPELQDIQQRQLAIKGMYTMPEAPDAAPEEHDIGGTSQAPAPVPNKNSVSTAVVPEVRLINGVMHPEMTIKPGETQLWRIGNIGANTFYEVAIDDVTFHVIAEDGSPVWEVWEAESLVLAPGKRFDVLIQGPPEGEYTIRTLDYMQGVTPANSLEVFPMKIGTLRSEGEESTPAALPTSMRERDGVALDDAVIAKERSFEFSIPFDPAHACEYAKNCGKQARVLFTINGKQFDADRVDAQPKLGTVEEWTLTNTSTEQHPFHIHVNDFQVMSVNGKPYDAKGLQDVVTIPVHGEVVIRNPFMDYTGKFVFHCHILNHEDGGMMGVVEVVE